MKKNWSQLALVVVAATCWPWGAVAQLAVERSNVDPHYLRFRHDPELLLGSPGDWGSTLLRATPSSTPVRDVTRSREVSANAASLVLEVHDPRLPMVARGDYAESSPIYWRRVRAFVGEGGPFDAAAEICITTGTLHAFEEESGSSAVDNLASTLTDALAGASSPMITIDAGVPLEQALALRLALRARRPGLSIGYLLSEAERSAPVGLWDYVIVRPESVPLPYRDQALMSYVRSRGGDIPVVLREKTPRLWPEIFWLATGAAGIFYDEIAPEHAPQHPREFQELRAVSSLVRAAGFSPIELEILRKHLGVGIEGAWGNRATARFALIHSGSDEATFQIGTFRGLPSNVHGFWYDPKTDTHLILPPVKCDNGGVLTLQPPTRDRQWVFGAWLIPRAEDRQTTIGPILPLDGEDEESEVLGISPYSQDEKG